MQWLYEAFYSAIGELFADINDLGVEIFDLSWVQAVVSLFTMLGWSLFVVGVVVAVFEVAIESQSGRVNIKGTALNVLRASLEPVWWALFLCSCIKPVVPCRGYSLPTWRNLCRFPEQHHWCLCGAGSQTCVCSVGSGGGGA